MPPKEKKESTELQVFNLENLNPALLPELSTFKEIQLKVVAENPFVAITDVASRELAKKHRTARVSARTSLQNQDKLISSKFNDAKAKAKMYIAELIAYTQPGEIEQQKEIDRDEAEAEAKRQEKARIEQQRIENIKKKVEDYANEWKTAFNIMSFDSITDVSANFLESYKSFDTTILEEFESLFPTKVEELSQLLSDKTVSLTNAENARLEAIRLEKEAAELRAEKARLEALVKIAEEAEAKAKAERESFEKEKAEFAEKQAIAAQKEQSEKDKAELEVKKLAEAKATKKVEIPEILVPETATVNVCTPIINDVVTKENTIVPTETTWDDIEKDFRDSGEKSYSKWLKSNYNVPIKL